MTKDQINEIFEREVAVFFVGTGTAANSLMYSRSPSSSMLSSLWNGHSVAASTPS